MRFKDTLLERGSRRPSDVARVLGVSRQAVNAYDSYTGRTSDSNKHKLLYRLAVNASDAFIEFLLNDANFDEKQRYKGAVNAEMLYQSTLPPKPDGTYGENTLLAKVKALKVGDEIAFQHHKTICSVAKHKLSSYGNYYCGYVYIPSDKELNNVPLVAKVNSHFSREITYSNALNRCLGFDLATAQDKKLKRCTDPQYLVDTLQELIRIVKVYL